MQFFYGSYLHDKNSVAFTGITNSFIRGQTGRPHLIRKSWSLKGKIIRPTQGEIMSVYAGMLQAYSINGMAAGMLDNYGGFTPFLMDSASAVAGTIITTAPSHGEISGAHGTTFLRYEFGIEADSISAGSADILSFSESVAFTNNGGGPIQVERIPAQGEPILQNVTEQSFYYATQQGQLSQVGANPQPMEPIWPELQRRQDGSATVTLTSPKTVRGVPIEYGVTWKYEFISTYEITGTPNIR